MNWISCWIFLIFSWVSTTLVSVVGVVVVFLKHVETGYARHLWRLCNIKLLLLGQKYFFNMIARYTFKRSAMTERPCFLVVTTLGCKLFTFTTEVKITGVQEHIHLFSSFYFFCLLAVNNCNNISQCIFLFEASCVKTKACDKITFYILLKICCLFTH